VTIPIAKTTLSKLVARARAGEEIILARGEVRLPKIVSRRSIVPKRRFGALHCKFSIGPGFL